MVAVNLRLHLAQLLFSVPQFCIFSDAVIYAIKAKHKIADICHIKRKHKFLFVANLKLYFYAQSLF